MARPKTPEGKRVTICIKFSEAQADAIEAARGGTERSEWMRQAVLAAAERELKPARRAPKAVTPSRRGAESASDIVAGIFRRTNGGN